jgi:hypothetical protein
MTPDWAGQVDAFIRQFARRAATWDDHPGDLEDGEAEPWTDPNHPDPVLDAAYRSGILSPWAQVDVAGGQWDSITILRARGRRLAKLIGRDNAIVDYASAKHFDLAEIPIDGLDHLEEDLRRLIHQPDRCIVRGQIAEIGRSHGVRRLLHPEGDDRVSLVEVPRRWLALDIDNVPRPANVPVSDLTACAGIAITALPPEFHSARCLAQATAGHGYKPGLRLRLWYWLDRPLGTAELKRWLAAAPVDHALFGAAQPIYTAAPVFAGHRGDTLPTRLVKLPLGDACVFVPEIPEPEPHREPAPVKPSRGLSRYAETAIDNAARSIAESREGGRDHAINSAAYGIGRLAGAGAIPKDFAKRVLYHAAEQVPGYSKRDLSKIDRSFANGLRNPREVPP